VKKQAIKAFVLLSLLLSLSAISAYAQSSLLISKVEIPFDFSVGDRTLPAGVYSVTRIFQDKVTLLIRSEDGREAIMTLTAPVEAKERPETWKLVFHHYGESYFLSQIWEPGSRDGRQLSKSRTEQSIERELAKQGAEPERVAPIVLSP